MSRSSLPPFGSPICRPVGRAPALRQRSVEIRGRRETVVRVFRQAAGDDRGEVGRHVGSEVGQQRRRLGSVRGEELTKGLSLERRAACPGEKRHGPQAGDIAAGGPPRLAPPPPPRPVRPRPPPPPRPRPAVAGRPRPSLPPP